MGNSEDQTTATEAVSNPRFDRYERASAFPQVVASALFLTAYAWPILDPTIHPGWMLVCRIGFYLSWAFFVVDYVIRLVLSSSRGQFITTNPLSLAIVFVPLVSPMRLLRLIPILRGERGGRIGNGRIAAYSLSAAVLVVFVGALVVLNAERIDPRANIKNFGDALWWAIETLTTVGFGDFYPVTLAGRVIATILMVGGIGLLGIVTAAMAAWLVNVVRATEEVARHAAMVDHIAELRAKLDELMPQLRHHDQTDSEVPEEPSEPAEPPRQS